ncbi:autotransporter assembly complex family protein [uncultured Paraglaciecola sp.]|uniref:autotransporter assembly complex protein TamA n=1 Tax=uncultured Paraglaciecola sp. TaxID=1765024 RepID=UPI0030DD4381|tara:strand:- start:2251 stop:4020 length:1770 start_codon:yes stop_codon:yes gene_type:complete
MNACRSQSYRNTEVTLFILRTLIYFALLALTVPSAFAISVDIEGADDSSLKDNIDVYIGIIGAPVNCELTQNYRKTVKEAVTKAAQAVGYYQLETLKMSLSKDKECSELYLTVQAGSRVKISKRRIELVGTEKPDDVLQGIVDKAQLKEGSYLEQGQYEGLKSKLLSMAQVRGYFDAKFTVQEIRIDFDTYSASVDLQFSAGKRYGFGKLIIPEDDKAQLLIREVSNFKEGDPYDADKLAIFNQNLKLTGYFQQVVARPLVSKADGLNVPIQLITSAKPRDTFNIGGGASTDTGPRLRFKWQRPWVNSKGHSLSAEMFISQPEQNASIKYKVPLEDPLNNYLSYQAGVKAENDNDTQSEALTLAVQRHWGSQQSDWQRIGFLRLEQEKFTQGTDDQQTTTLLLPGLTLSRRRARGGLDINWGDKQQYTLEGATQEVVSDIDLVRISLQSKWLRSYGKHRVFVRAELGAIATNDFSQVPSSLRYFAGGDQSVRGFALNTLSPEEDDELTGGQYLNVASAEYSYPVSQNWRMALFTDIGNASDKPFKDLATGIGLGASWSSPVGPIRFYFARGNSVEETTWRFHFSMGPVL